MADAATLRHYFRLGANENIISHQHFIGLSSEIGMTVEELEIIFTALDSDGKGSITLEELLDHWNESNASGAQNGYHQTEITPVNSPIDSEFESSFTLEESCNGGSLYTPSNSPFSILEDPEENFYNISHCHSPPLSAASTSNNTHAINGVSDNNNGRVYSPYRNHHHHNHNRHSGEFNTTTDHKNHNGFLHSNEYFDNEVETHTRPAASTVSTTQLAGRHLLSLREPSTSPEADFDSDSYYIISDRSLTPVNVVCDSPPPPTTVPNVKPDTMDSINTSSNSRHKDNNKLPRSNYSNRSTTSTSTHNSQRSGNDSYSPTQTDSQSSRNNVSSPSSSSSAYNNNNENHTPHRTKPTPSHVDQNSSFRVISESQKESDISNYEYHSHKTNSIRVLKTENDKTSNRESTIRSPITLELKPSLRRSFDVSESSVLNETIFEYDLPQVQGGARADLQALKEHRRRSLQHETVYSSTDIPDTRTEVGGVNLPVDLDPLSKDSQEQVCELYQNLHGASNPELVAQFENILLNVIKDVRQYKTENERLEKTYRKEKDEHDRHLRHMEDEMEQQVQNIEQRVRRQEKERLESEKIGLRIQLDSEISMLQQNLKKLQQDGVDKMDTEQEEHMLSMKKRLEEIQMQNRLLKSELTDAQTNLALVKTEMTSVKQQLDEKAYELDVENKSVEAYQNEQDNLRRQLQLLHEANKNLLDTNDNLREMLDTPPNGHAAYKRTTSTDSGASARSTSPLPPRKGSVMSDYVDAMSPGNRPLLQPSFQNEIGMLPQFMAMNHRFESCEEDSIAEELDSGHSTLRDANELNDDTELDSASIRSDLRRGRKHRRVKSSLRVPLEEEDESHDEMELESDGEDMTSPDPEMFRKSSPNHYRSPSTGSRSSNRSNRSLTREESLLSQTSRSSRGSSRRQLPAVPKTLAPIPVKITKEPDRVYKIVLAGDAAVGKSSFIVRLCKGKFVPNLSSTLGVDFQTKMLDVDSNTTALQLWDTAGQERFRSVARTYFRRADGVLLLYDVTYERSFLNIRDWVDAIEENAVKKIPIMLVGNKTDARLELENQGRKVVRYEDGLRLSKEIDAHFIESSAKEGSNIHEAVIELTRTLRTNEDLEVQTVGLTLSNVKDKKSSCCGKS